MKENIKNFLISSNQIVEYSEFNLSSGHYVISYPSKLSVPMSHVPDEITIGAHHEGGQNFNGCIDEFKIMSDTYSDFRSSAVPKGNSKNITEEYLDPEPQCPDSSVNLLIPFDDPKKSQVRELKRKVFLDSETNFKYKLSREEMRDLVSCINNENDFVSKMINMGFGKDISERTFYEVHKADGGPIYNIARYYPTYNGDVRFSSSGPNKRFSGSGRFIDGYSLSLDNLNSVINKDRFTIEMWISTEKDTYLDSNDRVFLDTRSVVKKIKKSKFNKFIEMNEAIERVFSVKLLDKKTERFISRYNDEVKIDEITGRLSGGGGVGKSYSLGYKLINNNKTILLKDILPKSDCFVEVIYLPKSLNESYISLSKTKYGTIKLDLYDGISNHIIEKNIRWMKNTWHRVVIQYSKGDNNFSLHCDGDHLKYSSSIFPKLNGSFGKINIGSNYSGDYSANSKISNIRISNIVRYKKTNDSGVVIDPGYNRNIDMVTPVEKDIDTNFIFDFNLESNIDNNFAILQNPFNSIYKFDVNISDNFNALEEDIKYDLLLDLINKIKPSHSNVKVKSEKFRC